MLFKKIYIPYQNLLLTNQNVKLTLSFFYTVRRLLALLYTVEIDQKLKYFATAL